MKVLTYTTLFPNNIFPNHGVFIKERMRFFAKTNELKVVAPVPYFPRININTKWYKFSKINKYELINNIPVWHPSYFITPKIGMSLYGDYLYLSTRKLVKEIDKTYRFDLLDAHYIYPDGYAAIKIAKENNKKVVVSARGTDINLYADFPIIMKKLIYTMNEANGVIAVSQSLKERICELGIDEKKVEVISNGVDFEKFYSVDQTVARNKVKIPLDKKVILSVGGLIERKGFHFLIDAFNNLVQNTKSESLLLVIVGEGENRKKLENQINKFNMNSHIRLTGAVPHDQLNHYYNACDIFTLVSSREGWPNVVMEAIACGKPVVATKIWGIPEIICNKNYGILVDSQKSDLISEALEKSLNVNWDSQKIADYAKQFSWQKVSNKLYKYFSSIE